MHVAPGHAQQMPLAAGLVGWFVCGYLPGVRSVFCSRDFSHYTDQSSVVPFLAQLLYLASGQDAHFVFDMTGDDEPSDDSWLNIASCTARSAWSVPAGIA